VGRGSNTTVMTGWEKWKPRVARLGAVLTVEGAVSGFKRLLEVVGKESGDVKGQGVVNPMFGAQWRVGGGGG
jgi:hypothetical protein